MLRFLALFCLFVGVSCSFADAIPLTAKDVSLMLRSGYSSDSVLRELSARRFADTFDSTTEKQLVQAGASSSLIEALRSGTYQLSAAEIAATKQKLAAQKRSEEFELAKEADQTKTETAVQTRSGSPLESQVGGTIYEHLKGDLVYWHQGNLVPVDDEALEGKKFYLLFFSAIWSREGRLFTPQLVDYYNRTAPQHPEFEVIFFSADRSPFAMQNYISQTNMPWPAIAYDKRGGKAGAIQGSLVRQIPCLVLADAAGKILSYTDGDGRTPPQKVLADLDSLLAGVRERPATTGH